MAALQKRPVDERRAEVEAAGPGLDHEGSSRGDKKCSESGWIQNRMLEKEKHQDD